MRTAGSTIGRSESRDGDTGLSILQHFADCVAFPPFRQRGGGQNITFAGHVIDMPVDLLFPAQMPRQPRLDAAGAIGRSAIKIKPRIKDRPRKFFDR